MRARLTIRHRRKPFPLVLCHDAQETVSARLDGEETAVSVAALKAHLGRCQRCRAFEADIVRLERQMRLGMARPVPAGLVTTLAAALGDARADGASGRLRRALLTSRLSTVGALRWSIAAMPALFLVVALPLGVGASAHQVPLRAPTLCSPTVLHE